MKIDEQGNLMKRKYGYPLDEADVTRLSVQADNKKWAQKSIKQRFSPDLTFKENGSTLTANLVDREGKSQGSVTFEPVTDATDGVIARVTSQTTPTMCFVSEVRYLATWPNNATDSSPYKEGEIVRKRLPTLVENRMNALPCIDNGLELLSRIIGGTALLYILEF